MKFNFKTGVALFLMSAPVFFVLFLHLFGKNHFEMSRLYCDERECYAVSEQIVSNSSNVKVAFLGGTDKGNELALERVLSVSKNDKIDFIRFYQDSLVLQNQTMLGVRKHFKMNEDSLSSKDLVLLDWESHICGFYNSHEDLEVEQLRNEIGVLLQEIKQD